MDIPPNAPILPVITAITGTYSLNATIAAWISAIDNKP